MLENARSVTVMSSVQGAATIPATDQGDPNGNRNPNCRDGGFPKDMFCPSIPRI